VGGRGILLRDTGGDTTPNLELISARTLPIGLKKDGIRKHETACARSRQFSSNSLKAACLKGIDVVGKSEWVGIRNPMLYPLELRAP
jgi:hypothetical protein